MDFLEYFNQRLEKVVLNQRKQFKLDVILVETNVQLKVLAIYEDKKREVTKMFFIEPQYHK